MNLPTTIIKKESLKYFWKTYPYKTIINIPWNLPDVPISYGSPWISENLVLDAAFRSDLRTTVAKHKAFVKSHIDIHCPKSNWFSRAIGNFGTNGNIIRKISYFFMYERPFNNFLEKNQEYISEYYVPSKCLLAKGAQPDIVEYRKTLYKNEYTWRVEIKKTKHNKDQFTDVKNMENLLFRENKNTFTVFTNEESNIVFLKLGHEAENITKITKAEII